jgi:hypothetical protein
MCAGGNVICQLAARGWRYPWLRIQRLIRSILETRWDTKTWPTAKATLKRALEDKKKIRREGWMN